MSESGGVEVAQLRDGEGVGRQREADVRVGELGSEPVAAGQDDRAMVERQVGKAVDRMPPSIRRHSRVRMHWNQAEVRGRQLPFGGMALRVGQGLQLLEVCELSHVHLRSQVAADRALERLAGNEIAARERPGPLPRRLRPLPKKYLEDAGAHLKDN